MFGQHPLRVAGEGHALADEHRVAHSHSQAHGFVVSVGDADRTALTVMPVSKSITRNHLHAVTGDGELILDDTDVPKAKGFDQGPRRPRRE